MVFVSFAFSLSAQGNAEKLLIGKEAISAEGFKNVKHFEKGYAVRSSTSYDDIMALKQSLLDQGHIVGFVLENKSYKKDPTINEFKFIAYDSEKNVICSCGTEDLDALVIYIANKYDVHCAVRDK